MELNECRTSSEFCMWLIVNEPPTDVYNTTPLISKWGETNGQTTKAREIDNWIYENFNWLKEFVQFVDLGESSHAYTSIRFLVGGWYWYSSTHDRHHPLFTELLNTVSTNENDRL